MSASIPSELRWLAKWLRPYLRWHIGSFLSISMSSMLGLITPLILKWLIDDILPSRHAGVLLLAIVCIFVCHVSRALFGSLASYLTANAVQRLSLDLRVCVLGHLNTLSASYYDKTPTGTAMYPLQDPVDEIAYFGSDLLPAILRTLVALAFTLATMVILNPRMTLALLPLIPVFILTKIHFTHRLNRDSEIVQSRQRNWNSFIQEHLAAVTCIQLLRKEARQRRQAFHLLATRIKSYDSLLRTGGWFTFLTSLSVGLGMSAVIGYGGWSVLTGSLSVGGLVAFYAYVVQLFDPLTGAAETYVRAKRTFASIRQVQSVFALETDIRECPAPIRLPRNEAMDIELRGVRFAYPNGRGQIDIPHLSIAAGSHVTIAGENGSGKSTVAKLLVRLYDVDAGSILCAGHDIREIEIQSLRKHICFAPSSPVLFDMSLGANLRLGLSGTANGKLREAIEIVGLTEFIGSLPRGLAEPIGPSGRQLSEGQRQRVGLARCILQRPEVLILDEATSSLDEDSEREILCRVRKSLSGSTIIAISHRISAIRSADRLIVMKAGVVTLDSQEGWNAEARSLRSDRQFDVWRN